MRTLTAFCTTMAFVVFCSLGAVETHAAVGDLYVSSFNNGTITRHTHDGMIASFSGTLSRPAGMAFDGAGNLFVAEGSANQISKITPSGVKTPFATGLNGPQFLVFDSSGNLFASDVNGNFIYKFAPDGTRTTFAANLNGPSGLAFNAAGELFESDARGGTINKFSSDGTKTPFASGLDTPTGIAVDRLGNVFVAEFGMHRVIEFSPDGTPVALDLVLTRPFPLLFDPAGNLLIADNQDGLVYSYSQDGILTVIAVDDAPSGLAVEPPLSVPLNISTRMQVLTGDNVLIGGFILLGADPKQVLVRGIGPSLGTFGITGFLQDPMLELHDSTGAVIGQNDDWRQTQESAILATGIAPGNDRESGILITLTPGAYTVIERGKVNGMGIGVVEVYDLEHAASSSLANLSTRGRIGSGGNVMIGGFIIGSGNGARVILRALGPSLSISGALSDPTLELHDGNGLLVTENDNWAETQNFEIQSTGIAPSNGLEPAIVAALPPGNYTAIVAGKNGGEGIGLVELYNLP